MPYTVVTHCCGTAAARDTYERWLSAIDYYYAVITDIAPPLRVTYPTPLR
jgi:hypothetical protein